MAPTIRTFSWCSHQADSLAEKMNLETSRNGGEATAGLSKPETV
jgi:hypothetical protein